MTDIFNRNVKLSHVTFRKKESKSILSDFAPLTCGLILHCYTFNIVQKYVTTLATVLQKPQIFCQRT